MVPILDSRSGHDAESAGRVGRTDRILAISFYMPPILTPRSLQVARTMKQLTRFGWECTVLSVEPTSLRKETVLLDPELEQLYQLSYGMVRAPSLENTSLARWLRRYALNPHLPGVQALLGGKLLWVPGAIQTVRRALASVGPFSAVISFATPLASHVVGRFVARETGLPWIVHFSDPWADSPYFSGGPYSRWLRDRIERQIVRDADRVVFVTQRTADLVMRKFPAAWRSKVHVVPHGYDDDLRPAEMAPSPTGGPLHLVHTGELYGLRDPDPLLRALEMLNRDGALHKRLKVTLVGSREAGHEVRVKSLGLNRLVEFAGPYPYLETLRTAAQADACLVMDGLTQAESVFLPSKLVDYLMLRKPILGITPAQGATADLLRSMAFPIAAPDDVGEIADAVAKLLVEYETTGRLTSTDHEGVAAEYGIESTTRLLQAVLQELLSSGKTEGGAGDHSART